MRVLITKNNPNCKRQIILGLVFIFFLTGCGSSSKGSSGSSPLDVNFRNKDLDMELARRRKQPCPSFLSVNPVQSSIKGVWLSNRLLPFEMRIAGKPQVVPGLRDVSEILLVLDDWRANACKAIGIAKGTKRTLVERRVAQVDNYLHGFTLILTSPYANRNEAEAELRKWVREVRDRLLRELMRGTG